LLLLVPLPRRWWHLVVLYILCQWEEPLYLPVLPPCSTSRASPCFYARVSLDGEPRPLLQAPELLLEACFSMRRTSLRLRAPTCANASFIGRSAPFFFLSLFTFPFFFFFFLFFSLRGPSLYPPFYVGELHPALKPAMSPSVNNFKSSFPRFMILLGCLLFFPC